MDECGPRPMISTSGAPPSSTSRIRDREAAKRRQIADTVGSERARRGTGMPVPPRAHTIPCLPRRDTAPYAGVRSRRPNGANTRMARMFESVT